MLSHRCPESPNEETLNSTIWHAGRIVPKYIFFFLSSISSERPEGLLILETDGGMAPTSQEASQRSINTPLP